MTDLRKQRVPDQSLYFDDNIDSNTGEGAGVIYTSPDVSNYNNFIFLFNTISTGNVNIQITLDGTTWSSADQAVVNHNATALNIVRDISTAVAGKMLTLGTTGGIIKIKKFRVSKSAASNVTGFVAIGK